MSELGAAGDGQGGVPCLPLPARPTCLTSSPSPPHRRAHSSCRAARISTAMLTKLTRHSPTPTQQVPGGKNTNNYANVQLITSMAMRTGVDAVWPGW